MCFIYLQFSTCKWSYVDSVSNHLRSSLADFLFPFKGGGSDERKNVGRAFFFLSSSSMFCFIFSLLFSFIFCFFLLLIVRLFSMWLRRILKWYDYYYYYDCCCCCCCRRRRRSCCFNRAVSCRAAYFFFNREQIAVFSLRSLSLSLFLRFSRTNALFKTNNNLSKGEKENDRKTH